MVGDELAGEAKMLQVSVIRLWNKTSATAMPAGRPFSPGPMTVSNEAGDSGGRERMKNHGKDRRMGTDAWARTLET